MKSSKNNDLEPLAKGFGRFRVLSYVPARLAKRRAASDLSATGGPKR